LAIHGRYSANTQKVRWWFEGERAQSSGRIYAFEGYLKSRIIAGSATATRDHRICDGTVAGGGPSESDGGLRALALRGEGGEDRVK